MPPPQTSRRPSLKLRPGNSRHCPRRNRSSRLSRAITPESAAKLNTAADNFDRLRIAPRGEIVSRASLRRELKTQVADLRTQLDDLSNHIIQFAVTGTVYIKTEIVPRLDGDMQYERGYWSTYQFGAAPINHW